MTDFSSHAHLMACVCAGHQLRAEHVTDRRCWNALRTKRAWLNGETGEDELSAAFAAVVVAGDEASFRPSCDAVWATVYASVADHRLAPAVASFRLASWSARGRGDLGGCAALVELARAVEEAP